MSAYNKFKDKIEKGFHICVGLDTDINKIPENLKKSGNPIIDFNKAVINATLNEAAAYKINFAFYEKLGLMGFKALEETINFIPKDVLIIADAKRGDIGNTSKKYAEAVFDYFKCDSITLHPYMGYDSIQPFLEYEEKICFILSLTSNKGANDFEKLKLENGNYLYQEVISKVNKWNTKQNCGLVFGATNSDELKKNISLFNNMPILLPGVGAQGASLENIAEIFKASGKSNYLVNISRGLIYCDNSITFENKIKEKIKSYNEVIHKILSI